MTTRIRSTALLASFTTIKPLAKALATVFSFTALAATANSADAIREAQTLYQQGKLPEALTRVDSVLRTSPKDAQGRFLRGLIYTEQNKKAEAIRDFTGLTEDYPELPEPYNNLAVLYASQGNLDKAKAALEVAIHTHPTYSTAHENLGDIYAQLATRAYDRALSLDKQNSAAQAKLSLVKDLFSASAPIKGRNQYASAAPTPVSAPAPTRVAQLNPTPSNPTPPVITAAPSPSPAPAVKAPAPSPAPAATPVTTQPTATTQPATSGNVRAEIDSAIQSWASAWAAKDLDSYFAAYTPDFSQPGLSNDAWKAQRRDRITRAKRIAVAAKLTAIEVRPSEVVATIRQSYQSDITNSENTKVLTFIRLGNSWLIKQERAN
jgi:predicted negative regulator of RcsB-dependent stress response